MWMPKHLYKTNVDGRRQDIIECFVEDEYLPFPSVRHDDMLDPLADITHKDLMGLVTFPSELDDNSRKVANTDWTIYQ